MPEYEYQLGSGCRCVVSSFDNLDHEILREFIQKRVNDGGIKRLIGKWLNAGVVEKGQWTRSEQGTPQGGLCKALHKPPYAKKVIMQSNHKINNNSKVS